MGNAFDKQFDFIFLHQNLGQESQYTLLQEKSRKDREKIKPNIHVVYP